MQLTTLHRFWGLTLLGLASAACSEGSVPIGEKDNEEVANASFAGTWDGYIEGFHFAGGSDRIRLVIDESGKGQLRFGDLDLIPKPTDQYAPYYPPQTEKAYKLLDGDSPPTVLHGNFKVFDGFNYPLQDVAMRDERIRLSAATSAIYEDLCAIQVAPYPAYYCLLDEMLPLVPSGSITDGCIEYSRKPYDGTIVDGSIRYVMAYDRTPTTIGELTSVPHRQYEDPYPMEWHESPLIMDFLSPTDLDYELTLPNLPPPFCKRSSDGVYHSTVADAQTLLDIGLDAALENDGNKLTGTLTAPVWGYPDTIIRTVRLTRVSAAAP